MPLSPHQGAGRKSSPLRTSPSVAAAAARQPRGDHDHIFAAQSIFAAWTVSVTCCESGGDAALTESAVLFPRAAGGAFFCATCKTTRKGPVLRLRPERQPSTHTGKAVSYEHLLPELLDLRRDKTRLVPDR